MSETDFLKLKKHDNVETNTEKFDIENYLNGNWDKINENAKNSKSSVSCESLMLDDISISDTIPVNDIKTDDVEFSHEAKIGKISDKTIFYLMSRGLSEKDAKSMIVRGFASPIAKELPLEYAVEMNNLINLELEGAIG